NPEALAKTIQKAVRASYRLDKVIANSVDTVLSVYAEEIKAFQKMIKDLDKAIEKVVQVTDEEQILRSIPGIGPVYAAGILAEIGQIERFDNEAKLAKYAGLSWREKQSGAYASDNTPLKRTGNAYLRYYLVEAANRVRIQDPVFGEYYRRKYQEVKHTPSKRALVLTARKLIRVIFFLLKNHQIYQEKR
ncbi:IS110 family transposase, partial [Lactobacillus reuteri]